MKILITGGSGLLGNNIVRQCLDRGDRPICLVRSKSPQRSFENLDVELLHGDLSHAQTLLEAAGRCDAIIHTAAHIQIGWSQSKVAMDVNRQGTENVVAAAQEHDLPLVHVSTANTLPVGNRQGSVTESSDHGDRGDQRVRSTYVVSKIASEQVVDAAVAAGLRAMIVHPGFMLGPWDWKPSSGQMILELDKRWSPMAPSGGNTVNDVRHVAAAILTTLDRGVAGRRYLLGGQNVTFLDLWTRFSHYLGKRPPITILRRPGQLVVGTVGDLISKFSSHESDLNSAAIRMGSQFHWYDSRRAIDELDYQISDLDECIAAEIEWLREYRYL
jgi:dihydroflavonol-4-reductase